MNKVFIVGRLTRAPEARTTPTGVSVTTFSVAVNRRQNREETDFINVVAWRGLADICGKYLVQGQRVAVVGELRTRNYEGKDGIKRYVTEVQADDVEFLDRPTGTGNSQYGGGSSYQANPQGGSSSQDNVDDIFSQEMGDVLIDDEDLPF
ncbi:MAG: single-stranded DNA-binding protein [Clostridia bacterium]|nr:single-stranded DNA-binding protein [Clostridia bacterium]